MELELKIVLSCVSLKLNGVFDGWIVSCAWRPHTGYYIVHKDIPVKRKITHDSI